MDDPHRRRTVIASVIGGAATLALLIAIGVFGLLRGNVPAPATSTSTSAAIDVPKADRIDVPHPLATALNPESFARRVAAALFDWDTRGSAGPSEWALVLIDIGDPDEAAGLAADIRGYLPSAEQWRQLETYGTQQWLSIESVRVPETWAIAVAQAAPGQLPPGAIAYTVSGVRHRVGVWGDQTTSTSAEVAFTVFLACPHDESCRLLRISLLNKPLE
ncbi:hypothetical protein [Microbacterium pygmaeum]|uniref:Uncharacterized protein n=1 Tax=Microbacterium pygmaeum TaxID=370764 RepID=A0A1G7XH60_9MICO|nr:hypothetical protein [Microbacterium pygmaeum]SDG83542.1 hypothetical protein SAMN04489810_1423 [Microbacterium pygmaeum]